MSDSAIIIIALIFVLFGGIGVGVPSLRYGVAREIFWVIIAIGVAVWVLHRLHVLI